MNTFFIMGTKVELTKYPGVVFQVVQEDTNGWVFQVMKNSETINPYFNAGDIVYVSHSSELTMKAVNNQYVVQNNLDAAQSGQYVPQDTGEVTVPASAVRNNSIGIGGAMVRSMIEQAERNM